MKGPLQDRPAAKDAVPLRAHNLLCLQGFQGSGYDEAFTANMSRLHAKLRDAPTTMIRIAAGPDHLCAACPHLDGDRGCALGRKPHEAHMRSQDADVSARLGLVPGRVLAWSEILARIAKHVAPDDLPAICTTCPWLPLGSCAAGIAALRAVPAGAPRPRGEPA